MLFFLFYFFNFVLFYFIFFENDETGDLEVLEIKIFIAA